MLIHKYYLDGLGGYSVGSVKVDLHSKELLYKNMFLSDIEVVQLLIEYRYKYDGNFQITPNNMFSEAGEITQVNHEAIVTYASLDNLIESCNFNIEQLRIIEMIEQGNELKDIAVELGYKHSKNVRKRLNKILKDIVEMNDRDWRKVVYVEKLDLKTKRCRKCKEELPATEEFFTDKNDSFDGLHPYCKKCRK